MSRTVEIAEELGRAQVAPVRSGMSFGFCYIPDYHPNVHGDFSAWYRRLLSEWQLADALKYDSVWIAEHRYPGYAFSSTPVVAQAIAGCTQQIRIGTAVALLPQRHPVLTAEDWAAVDLLSGGRLNFGIGRGIFAYDFAAVGVNSAESRGRFEEAWDIIRRLWTEDNVTYRGKYWSFAEHTLAPKPLQKPTPPAFVGCIATPESYQWAGAHGMNLIIAPFLLKSTEQQRVFLDMYRESLAKAGHDPADFQVLANYHLAIVDREEQLAGCDEYIFRYLHFLEQANNSQPAWLDPQQYAAYASGAALGKDVQELRDHRAVLGTPQQCIDRIGELADECGLTGWMFHINYGGVPQQRVIDQMHLFAAEVAPVFANSQRAKGDRDQAAAPLSATIPSRSPAEIVRGNRCVTSLATGYWRSCTLFAANKLDVFSKLGGRTVTAAVLAGELHLDPRGLEKLLTACASLGLVEKLGPSFRLSPLSRQYLDRSSPTFLGDWVAHWADMLVKGNWTRLDESVASGESVVLDGAPVGFDSRQTPLRNWIVGMHGAGLAGHAELVAQAAKSENPQTLLDVGGGPGTYSMALCRRYPELRATVADAPDVAQVARGLVRQANLQDRIHYTPVDFRTQSLGKQFDLVLLSNVLHMDAKPGAMAMLRNAAEHLHDDGELIVQEWLITDDLASSDLATLFNLHILINPGGDIFGRDELRAMIEESGFICQETITTGGLYDVILARKRRRQ